MELVTFRKYEKGVESILFLEFNQLLILLIGY
jgi:hypothetical protein